MNRKCKNNHTVFRIVFRIAKINTTLFYAKIGNPQIKNYPFYANYLQLKNGAFQNVELDDILELEKPYSKLRATNSD